MIESDRRKTITLAKQMSIQENNSSEQTEYTASETQENNSVSQLLRQLRKEKGLSLQDITRETNISTSNLVSIEHEAYEDLPADTFIRGQIAIYGNLLGINGADAAKRFLTERHLRQQTKKRQGLSGREQCSMSAKKLSEPSYVSSATLAGGLLLLLVLILTAFSLYTGWNPFAYLMKQEQPPSVLSTTPIIVPEPADEAVVTPPAPIEEESSQQTVAPSETNN